MLSLRHTFYPAAIVFITKMNINYPSDSRRAKSNSRIRVNNSTYYIQYFVVAAITHIHIQSVGMNAKMKKLTIKIIFF